VTLEELAATLPNGFHDAEFKRLAADYRDRRVSIDVAVWIGDMDENFAPTECYRDGELVIEGLQFLVIEPPDQRYPYAREHALRVDLGMPEPGRPKLPKPPNDCFLSSFFVNEWNAFIWISGRAANLTWTGAAYDRKSAGPA
jgi:hypothetical protein